MSRFLIALACCVLTFEATALVAHYSRIWQSQVTPFENITIEFRNGDKLTGNIVKVWSSDIVYELTTGDGAKRRFGLDAFSVWTSPVRTQASFADRAMPWREFIPPGLMLCFGLGCAWLMLRSRREERTGTVA